jgi:integrase
VKVLAVAEVSDLRLHDLRHAFATRGAGMGATALILRDALGHRTLAMTSRYVAKQVEPVRLLGDRIADQIVALGKSDIADKVEPLPRRKRASK